MILRLDPQHLASIKAHAESAYPNECCGLLLGKSDPTGKTVMEVRATQNVYQDESPDLTQKRRYEIPPEAMLAAMKDGRTRGLEIIGVYHSHPDHAAIPSECDRAAAWSQFSYAIVAVPKGKATDVQSWSLNEMSQFEAETISVTATQV